MHKKTIGLGSGRIVDADVACVVVAIEGTLFAAGMM
jgi:hypothetical protein